MNGPDAEREFLAWLDSIEFVDGEGEVVTPDGREDASSDPEGDRTAK